MAEKNKKGIGGLSAKTIKRIKIGALIFGIVFAVLYICYLLYQVGYSKIVTEQALNITISDEIETTGITVRDEQIIENRSAGFIISAVTEGRKVSKGETIAYRFKSAADAQAFERINEIDEQIAQFKNMETAGEESAADANSLEKLLDERFNALNAAINSGDLSELNSIKNDIAYILNKRQIYMKKADNFNSLISQLKAERDNLSKTFDVTPATIKADRSGYFVGVVDGYEKMLTTSTVEKLSADQLGVIMQTEVEVNDDDHIGKIAEDYKWNIACVISVEDAARLKPGNTYTLQLPYSEAGSIRAQLQSIKADEDGSRAVVIFSCSYLFSELTSVRTQPVIIKVKTYEGIGIKTSAIRTRQTENKQEPVSGSDVSVTDEEPLSDFEEGVYVLWGNEVLFKRIEVLYKSKEGIAVVKKTTDQKWLNLYDDVIVEGRGLYGGKIVDDR